MLPLGFDPWVQTCFEATAIHVSEMKVFGSCKLSETLQGEHAGAVKCHQMSPRIWHAFHIYCFHCCHSYLSWLCMPACFKGMCWDDFEERPGAQFGIGSDIRSKVPTCMMEAMERDSMGPMGPMGPGIPHLFLTC